MMANVEGSVNISAELAALKHEKNNQEMKALPPNTKIQRRPLYHPPIASPTAGGHIQKVVYVSNHTPIMSAVKRVKKLLSHVEKRAIQSVDAKRPKPIHSITELAEASERLRRANEEVLVKASGRAMSQALKIGEWFRTKDKEMVCKVEVRTGSVQAIDDIVETETVSGDEKENEDITETTKTTTDESTVLTGGETTLELLGPTANTIKDDTTSKALDHQEDSKGDAQNGVTIQKKRKRTRRKRSAYTTDDVPEARIRWVKYVEVAISLKA